MTDEDVSDDEIEEYENLDTLIEEETEVLQKEIEKLNGIEREPEIIREWTVTAHGHDIQCRLKKHGWLGHYCGYVQCPVEVANIGYDTIYDAVSVHSGLTYGIDEERFVGFDTGHAWDVCLDADNKRFGVEAEMPSMPTFPKRKDWHQVWTPEGVAEETERLAEEIASLAPKIPVDTEGDGNKEETKDE